MWATPAHAGLLGQEPFDIHDALDGPPVLNLLAEGGSASVEPTAIGSAWVFEHEALAGHPEKARFRLALGGKTYIVDMPCAHDHDHGAHGPHDGVLQTLADGTVRLNERPVSRADLEAKVNFGG